MHKGRWLFLVGGWIFTGLALIGAVLPLLPTTPFLLLAGMCFARSSPTMHERIWRLPIFGRYLRQWEDTHTVPPDAKRRAWTLIVVSLGISIYLVEGKAWTLALLGLGLVLMICVALLPEKPRESIPSSQSGPDGEGQGATAPGMQNGKQTDSGGPGGTELVERVSEETSRGPDR
ncbi:MAG: YbaN family protein [Planctomycetota bacterium]|nr:YbaN family protein [Planctomycetota bacterium]